MNFWQKKLFKDRIDAGRKVAEELKKYNLKNVVVLAIPRGGVQIGFEIAKILKVPLDVIIARKIGAPQQPEFGIGAVAEERTLILDKRNISYLKIPKEKINKIMLKESEEMARRINLYRDGKSLQNIEGKTVVLVDDGLATGVTAKAAIKAVKKLHPKKIIFAAPVCALDSAEGLKKQADEILCLATPSKFEAVGNWYRNFEQVTDENVRKLLEKASQK